MADHSKPTVTSTYADFVTELDGRLDDLARGLDPATTSPTNLPVGSVYFSASAAKWLKTTAGTPVDLAATYAISISGNAATVTNGVYTSGSYADPAWITSISGAKVTGAIGGNAATASALATARTINGVSFNGTANITVNVANNLTFNNAGSGAASGVTFNGGTATTISYNTIGAPSATGAGASGTWAISISGAAATAGSAISASQLATTNFSIQEVGGELVFFNGATRIAKLTAAGKFVAIENEANATI